MYYANINSQKISDSAGTAYTIIRYKPVFTFGTKTKFELQILDNSGNPVALNASDTFTLALDNNFIHTDELMCYSSDASVVDAENGIISIIVDSNTIPFESKLNGAEQITAWLEVIRYAVGSTEPELIVQDQCTCRNRVQTTENEPSSVEVEYLTAAQIEALLASGVNLQFSADSESWHAQQVAGDAYVRFQLAVGSGSVWTAPIEMPKVTSIGLAACSGLGEYLSDNSFTMTWVDPDDVTLNGATLAAWNQTVLVRKVGSYPADHTDGTILATTSRELGNKNAYRSTGYTDSERESGIIYYYKLFSQTTAGVWNNLTGNQFAESTNMSWGMVQGFVRAGRGADIFPVGTVFEVEHPEYTVDGHGIYFRVAGHDQVPAADESLMHTMCLEMVDILFVASYDAEEQQYALTEDATAQAGKEYYTYNGSSYTKLIDGTDYDAGDPVPAASWYEKNLNNRDINGSNNAEQSNMIQWLNSSGAANQWFTPQTLWDQCSSALQAKSGFMRYLDPEFAAVVQHAKLITAKYSQEGGSFIHNAKFWPLSKTQVFGTQTGDIMENVQLEYYSDGNSVIKQLNGENAHWWIRSPSVYNPYDVSFVTATGSTTLERARTAVYGFSAACIIA